ncbi:MAG: HlyD family efflux transporter periplasmic adaptor subunit [Candidatus Taylorbacteria bacterium]
MKKITIWSKMSKYMRAHKLITTVIIIVCLIAAYYIYKAALTANAVPQYVLTPVSRGSIRQTVTGSGQVSASNQTDIQGQVSGTVTGIYVSVGQTVTQGQLIATIDSKNASISLQNSRLSYEKLVAPAKATDISNANNSVDQAYTSAFNAASNIYLNMPGIVSGMKDLLYGQTGFITDQRSSYLNSSARTYRDTAGIEYDAAVNLYQASLTEFKSLSRSSATSSINKMLTDTYTAIKAMSKAVSDTQVTITYVTTTQPDYYAKEAATAQSNVTSWVTQVNSDLSNLASARNSIESNTNSFTTLVEGADQYDLKQAQLSLQQAQQTYDNYFIRAPYDGVIGRISVSLYGQSGSGAIATIIGKDMISTISLNEVDAARVKAGQLVEVTFDAIDGLNATGTVKEIELVGTVSQGVVSYPVKIAISTVDERIKPGMSINATIITNQKNDIIVVPSTAIKTLGKMKYVETLEGAAIGSSTKRTITISSAISPTKVPITIGETDDTNSEILTGLDNVRYIITKTTAASAVVSSAATPTLFSSMTNRRPNATGTTRTTSAPVAGPGAAAHPPGF